MHDGKGVQVIARAGGCPLPVVDLAGQPEVEGLARRLMNESLQAGFDLATGPLLWAKLFRLAPQEHWLLVNVHHIVSDGWSLGVFNREWSGIYAALCAGDPIPLPPLSWQYADYVRWQRQWLQGPVRESQARTWQRQLANAPLLELPTDFPRPSRVTYAGARQPGVIARELAGKLAAFNRQAEVTPFMSLLAVFHVLLARHSRQEDIMVGTPVANRQRVEVEGVIGFFVNTLVMRGDPGRPDFRELVRRVRLTALEAYQHQDLPFEELVRMLNPARDLSRNPVFQVLFAFQNAPEHPLQLAGLETSVEPVFQPTTHFDLELQLWRQGEGWTGWFVYNTDLFAPETMQRFAGHYLGLLEALLSHPDEPVAQVEMLTPAERHQLAQWNDTAADYPRDQCVHQLFEAQVKLTPEAVAIMCEGRSLTYRDLDQRASQLARTLQTLGVGPDVLVAICLERSPDLVMSLLGVLKAGGAYVRVDRNIPRIAWRSC